MASFIVPYVVEGWGFFPTDMLRYDFAVYASEAAKEEARKNVRRSWDQLPRRVLLICRFCDNSLASVNRCLKLGLKPCVDRWRSFGWEVKEIGDPVRALKAQDMAFAQQVRELAHLGKSLLE